MRLAALVLAAAVAPAVAAPAARAQDARPEAPAPAPEAPAPDAPAPAPEDDPRRQAHLRALAGTVVHFDFRRAPLEDVAAALATATGVPVRVGDAARKVLERRRLRLRYVADRTGRQVLDDLAKAAALDAEVTPDGAVLDTPREVRRLRTRLGLPARAVELTADDVARLLDAKRLSLVARERPLAQVLAFLRDETGVRLVRLDGDAQGGAERPEPAVTATLTDEPLRVVLDRVLAPLGWAWTRQGTVVVVGPAEVVAAHVEPEDAEGPAPER